VREGGARGALPPVQTSSARFAHELSADETADVGVDNQTPVAEGIGIGPETRFTGTIKKITLEVRK
jgi:hypothetical protein